MKTYHLMNEPTKAPSSGIGWGIHSGVHFCDVFCKVAPKCVDLGEGWIRVDKEAVDNLSGHTIVETVVKYGGKLIYRDAIPAGLLPIKPEGMGKTIYYRIANEEKTVKKDVKRQFSEDDTPRNFICSLMDSGAPGWVLAPAARAVEFGIKVMVKKQSQLSRCQHMAR